MLSKNISSDMNQIMMLSMEQMVPSNHLLRKISKISDFQFVYDLCEPLYSDIDGRPSIDPVVLVKLALIQKLFGIRSMRQTIKEVEVNVAYRWFLGYNMVDKIPHFGTFSKNYIRRFKGSNVFETLFSKTLELCISKAHIDTSIIFIDSTHVKACANKRKNHTEEVEKATSWYSEELQKEIGIDREIRGKKPLKQKEEKEIAKVAISNTDPESGLFRKGEHKEVFAYSVQTACDKNAFILGYTVHPGNEHDSKTFPAINEEIKKFNPEMVVLDSGYKNAQIAHKLLSEGIKPLFPYKRPMGKKDLYKKNMFAFDEFFDCYICPNGKILKYTTTNRDGYREYKSNPYECMQCPNKSQCTQSKNNTKLILRHIWEEDLEKCEDIRHTLGNKEIYNLRKETIERDFGLAKETMGYRYTMYKGKRSMEITAALTYTAINLKKLVNYLEKCGKLVEETILKYVKNLKIIIFAEKEEAIA